MTSLKEQLESYGAYHRDPRNKLTHFVGVPLVTFSIFLVLSWFRFIAVPEPPVTGALLFYVVVFAYYLRLDWPVALLQAPVNLLLLGLADRAALLPFRQSLAVFLIAFVLGGPFNCWAMPSRDAARRWPTTCSRSSMRSLSDRRGALSLSACGRISESQAKLRLFRVDDPLRGCACPERCPSGSGLCHAGSWLCFRAQAGEE